MAKFSRSSLVKYVVDNMSEPDIAEKVAGFLIDNGKVSELDSILRDVMELQATSKGVVELSVKSAFELDEQSKESIRVRAKQLYPNAKSVVIHEVIDKSLIGGADIQFANANLDLTVRAKLNRLKEAVN